MRPCEVGTALRQRNKEQSVKLNYGALYAVVESLRKRGLTDAGRVEVSDWLADLPPEQVLGLLRERLQHLAMEDAQAAAARELMHKRGLPRLLWVEEEYRDRIRAAEIDYVRALVRDIESGTLEGADWWRLVHERGFGRVPPPFAPDDSPEQGE